MVLYWCELWLKWVLVLKDWLMLGMLISVGLDGV